MEINFTYLEHPEKYSPLSEEEETCDFCGQEKLCMDASFLFGEEEYDFICPECLAGGKLIDREIFTCDGDIDELRRQLRVLHPEWSEEMIEADAEKKTIVLEKTTPQLISWQDWVWPAADGDYCRFIGYGSKEMFAALAPGTNGQELFKNSLYYTIDEDVDDDELWEEVLPDEDITDYNDSAELPVLFYVFRSLHSDRIVTVWDSN